ncbi:MAG: hypothetical protein GEU94_04220 [Micromonosporaceae bacterium]|nr:hypothetical protein [Micromonosporaceae bacterium]
MTDDPSPQPDRPVPGAGQGWTAMSYLIAGMAVWGFVGWLVDQWLDSGGIATAVGIVVGTVAAIYLVARRFGPR